MRMRMLAPRRGGFQPRCSAPPAVAAARPRTPVGAAELDQGGILRVGTINYIDSLNPFVAIESQSYNAFVMVYPQLVQYGPGPKLEGDWATSWSHSADGLTWTFKLKPRRQVVGRHAADRRRRRLDGQHRSQVPAKRDRGPGRRADAT